MLALASLSIVLFLAFANGANDNFKGVATLFGSRAATYKSALTWATLTTVLGSVAATFLARGLVAAFSGKGLVPDAVAALPAYTLSVVLAAAVTVMLATRFGFPVSTTHALTGGLVGAGLLASPTGVAWSQLGGAFFAPLVLSPLLAIATAATAYVLLHGSKQRTGVTRQTCVCVGTQVVGVAPAGISPDGALAMYASQVELATAAGGKAACVSKYSGTFVGVEVGPALDKLHFLSAGAVCFARALNDTPKIAAVLLVGSVLSPVAAIALVTAFVAVGGLLNSRRIADTMAHKVTQLNPGQGLTANLVTGLIVIGASKLGMPVSTTHVACGSLFGIGTVTRQANGRAIVNIVLAWVTTLPVAAALGAAIFGMLRLFKPF